jgi:hypothetical protein
LVPEPAYEEEARGAARAGAGALLAARVAAAATGLPFFGTRPGVGRCWDWGFSLCSYSAGPSCPPVKSAAPEASTRFGDEASWASSLSALSEKLLSGVWELRCSLGPTWDLRSPVFALVWGICKQACY